MATNATITHPADTRRARAFSSASRGFPRVWTIRWMRITANAIGDDFTPGTKTCCGARLGRGVFAVDPTVIPLGAEIDVPGYGHGKALDTGSSIKGNRMDVGMDSVHEAKVWGVQWRDVKVTVYRRYKRYRDIK